jgi:hypothetical protein
VKARAVNPRKPNQMTPAEKAWAVNDWFVGNFADRRYEAITIKIGEFRYTPDFSAVDRIDGQMCFFEVKASDHRAAYTEAARLRIKAAAHEWGAMRFYLVFPKKGSKMREWVVTVISNHTGSL